jgi:hypothetical protein
LSELDVLILPAFNDKPSFLGYRDFITVIPILSKYYTADSCPPTRFAPFLPNKIATKLHSNVGSADLCRFFTYNPVIHMIHASHRGAEYARPAAIFLKPVRKSSSAKISLRAEMPAVRSRVKMKPMSILSAEFFGEGPSLHNYPMFSPAPKEKSSL